MSRVIHNNRSSAAFTYLRNMHHLRSSAKRVLLVIHELSVPVIGAAACSALFVVLLGCCGVVSADARYPEKPVRIIVGQAPGDTADLLARLLAPALSDVLGQRFYVENHAGANGNVATALAAKARADGYTLMLVPSTFASNAVLYPKAEYQPLRDFTPIARVADVHQVLVVQPSSHVKTLRELVEYVQENPGRLTFASGGTGTPSHLAAELLKLRAGPLNTLHVPFKGVAPALTDLLGGRVDLVFAGMTSAYPQIRSGRVKALAVAGARRAAVLPHVPTIAESGYPGFDATIWHGVLAPAGTPYEIVVRLSLGTGVALNSPGTRERIAALGAEAADDKPDEFTDQIRVDLSKWAQVGKAAGIALE